MLHPATAKFELSSEQSFKNRRMVRILMVSNLNNSLHQVWFSLLKSPVSYFLIQLNLYLSHAKMIHIVKVIIANADNNKLLLIWLKSQYK